MTVQDQPTTLVTGGAGYVGSVLVSRLLAAGRKVRVLDTLLHGPVPSLLPVWSTPSFEFVQADVRDEDARRNALAGVRDVVHLAAVVGDPACARDPELARAINFEATKALVREAHEAGVDRFVFASTCSNYGRLAEGGVATEEWDLNPVSLYAETKVSAELDVLSYAGNGFAPTCLRFATVYGSSPRMRFDLTVNEFARDAYLSQKLLVYGEQFWRPYIHVKDAAEGIAAVLEAPRDDVAGEVFNVGSTEENYRKLDLVKLLEERIPELDVEYVQTADDPRDYRVSFEKIASKIGYSVGKHVPDGLDEVGALVESGLLDPFAPAYRN